MEWQQVAPNLRVLAAGATCEVHTLQCHLHTTSECWEAVGVLSLDGPEFSADTFRTMGWEAHPGPEGRWVIICGACAAAIEERRARENPPGSGIDTVGSLLAIDRP